MLGRGLRSTLPRELLHTRQHTEGVLVKTAQDNTTMLPGAATRQRAAPEQQEEALALRPGRGGGVGEPGGGAAAAQGLD